MIRKSATNTRRLLKKSVPSKANASSCFDAVLGLDLGYIVDKLIKQPSWDEPTAQEAVRRYKNYLILHYLYPKQSIVPTQMIDEAWHQHILHTEQYIQDCDRIFGKYLHHRPSSGSEEEQGKLSTVYQETAALYEKTFEESYDLFPTPSLAELVLEKYAQGVFLKMSSDYTETT